MSENIILYREQQRFRQVWLWIIILGVSSIFWAGFIYQVLLAGQFGNRPVSDIQLVILFVLMGIGLPVFFYLMNLITEVRPDEMHIRFWPFHVRPVIIPMHLIKDFTQVTYNPVSDYGGWGIRWSMNGKAYNISGNKGVKLTFYNKRPLLIGSQDAGGLYDAIKLAKELKAGL